MRSEESVHSAGRRNSAASGATSSTCRKSGRPAFARCPGIEVVSVLVRAALDSIDSTLGSRPQRLVAVAPCQEKKQSSVLFKGSKKVSWSTCEV
jgi:hypothetical protein